MNALRDVILVLFILIFQGCTPPAVDEQNRSGDKPAYLDTSLDFETRTADLVERMTLDEKISQLVNASEAIPRLGIQKYDWWNECLHGVAVSGHATVFPQAIGMAATFDRDMMYKTACVISDEARAKHHEAVRNGRFERFSGLTFWSPNINIFRDPRWGRGQETYGEDPYLTGQMGIQFVKGLQGDDPKYLKVVSTAKHYAVHSGPEPERHHFNAIVNSRDLWETYLPAFNDLVVKAKVYSVMGAYNRVDGESASASWMLLEDILRNKWGFEGYVVSDCGAIADIFDNHKIVDTAEKAAALGVRRGCDLNCGNVYKRALKKAVEEGLITEGEISLAVCRLMLARMKLGMFDPPDNVPYAKIPYQVNDSPQNDKLALKMSRESIVLLKNKDGFLPLDKKKVHKIAVIGPNADNIQVLLGNYNGTPSNPSTILAGIRQAAGNDIEVLYSYGCGLVEGFYSKAIFEVIDSQYLRTVDDAGREVNGLTGQYFNNMEMTGEPVFSRIDSRINFDWRRSSPTSAPVANDDGLKDVKFNDDYFSVRWTGQLTPAVSGEYLLGINSDDGCRLYVNGEKIAEDWTRHAMKKTFAKINLEAGKNYDIKIEYYEETREAGIEFIWAMQDSLSNMFDEAVEYTRQADVAIFVGGLDPEIEGEEMRVQLDGFKGGDRTKIELPETQHKLLKAMYDTGTPVVFVILGGGPIAVNWADENLPAILMAWYPGQRGGNAVADVLFGDYNPAGRLPVTFYKSTEEVGDFRDYNMSAGKGKTYRYYRGEPLYPFGHGLSYSRFEYSDIKVSTSKIETDSSLTVSCKVKNTGVYDGEEVVQLYVSRYIGIASSLPMPVKQLRGFERIELKKEQTKEVTFNLNATEDMRYYDAELRKYNVEPGQFEIQIGPSSSDIRLRAIVEVCER